MTLAAGAGLEGALQGRYEKSAAALLAVGQVIAKHRLLKDGEADEFLRLIDGLQDASPDSFTTVWQDPFCYWWTRLAYQLVSSCLTGTPPGDHVGFYCEAIGAADARSGLKLHLEEFKRIVLGLALVSGTDLNLQKPLTSLAPLVIPGTRLTVEGRELVTIGGVREGRLVSPGGSAVWVSECPVASDGELLWRLLPAVYRLPALGLRMPDSALEPQWQAGRVATTEAALRLIRRYAPDLTVAFPSAPRIISFKPQSMTDDFTNVTHSEIPGSFICSFVDQPHYLADSIVHEFYHGLLYAIEEESPFFEPGAGEDLSYYSPWRFDLRDLSGVLHAFYVYLAITRFWLGLQQGGGATGEVQDYATDRLIRYPLQLRIGEAVLLQHGRFSPYGAALFADLRADLASLLAAIQSLGLPADTLAISGEFGAFKHQTLVDGRPLSVREIIRDHGRKVRTETGLDVSGLIEAAIS